jgi:hypothetical protein
LKENSWWGRGVTSNGIGRGEQTIVPRERKYGAHTMANLADSIAKKSADVANKSMEMVQVYQTELRVIDARLAVMNKTQNAAAL